MLNFEEELKKFQPCLEVEDIEDAVYQEDLADMTGSSERSYRTNEVKGYGDYMEYTQKVVYQSNYWYNDGLKKAKIRDMTGAVTSLKKSLQFNSENIAARNLLGLVYYGRGEVGEALVEWILSEF